MVTQITTLPTPPSRQRPTEFSSEADTFLNALPVFGKEANDLATEVNLAATQVVPAVPIVTTARDEAVQARDEAVLLTEAYQGALASDPLLDKNGNAITAGDWYTNTTSGYIRAFNGTSWVNGITAVSGVNSINGATGDVTITVSSIGDVIYTANNPDPTKWLECDGSIYLQSSYPELFSKIGTQIDPLCGTTPVTFDVPPSTTVRSLKLDNSDTYLACGLLSTPYIYIAKRNGFAFTKLTDPLTLPTGVVNDICWSNDSTYLVVCHHTSPYVTIYKRSGDTFTKLANPATLPTGTAYAASFDSTGTYLVVTHDISPYITIYKRSGDTFTKLANPATLPTGSTKCCAWDNTGTLLVVGGQYNNILVYSRNLDTFTLTSTLVDVAAFCVNLSFSPDNQYLAAIQNSPQNYLRLYKNNNGVLTLNNNTPNVQFTGSAPDEASGLSWDISSKFLVATPGNVENRNSILERQGEIFSKRDYRALSNGYTSGTFSNSNDLFITSAPGFSYLAVYTNYNYDKLTQFKLPSTHNIPQGKVKAYIKVL